MTDFFLLNRFPVVQIVLFDILALRARYLVLMVGNCKWTLFQLAYRKSMIQHLNLCLKSPNDHYCVGATSSKHIKNNFLHVYMMLT